MIEINGLSKRFRNIRVIDNLSLRIKSGDRVALIGSNGAGKTTLIRCLLGEYVHEGEILVDGLSPRHNRTGVLRDIGFVPQLPPPLAMPVDELIRFAAGVCDADPGHMKELGQRLGLDFSEAGAKPFNRLSGGQKQKILVAIAMGRETKLLILDEPTANLDPAARQILFEMLAERIDRPIIISSHRLEEVSNLVNRVIEMDRGKIVLDDRVSDMVEAGASQQVLIRLSRPEPAFARAMAEWGFESSGDDRQWNGELASPDRLRFLGVLARYAGILSDISMKQTGSTNEKEKH